VRIPNEPSGEAANVFSDLIRLQSEFHARLAEETLRYFRRIQGAAMPAAPGTVVTPDGSVELAGYGAPGSTIELEIEIENLQRVHCVATPMLSPLVDPSGTTWFPVSESSMPALVAPGEVAAMTIRVPVPKNLPPAIYRGALLLQGFREGAIPVALTIADSSHTGAAETQRDRAAKTARKRPRKKSKKEGRSK
jgi:hypothetical protein